MQILRQTGQCRYGERELATFDAANRFPMNVCQLGETFLRDADLQSRGANIPANLPQHFAVGHDAYDRLYGQLDTIYMSCA